MTSVALVMISTIVSSSSVKYQYNRCTGTATMLTSITDLVTSAVVLYLYICTVLTIQVTYIHCFVRGIFFPIGLDSEKFSNLLESCITPRAKRPSLLVQNRSLIAIFRAKYKEHHARAVKHTASVERARSFLVTSNFRQSGKRVELWTVYIVLQPGAGRGMS